MDPALAYDTVAMDVIPLALESLYQYKYTKSPLELEPLLADGMSTVSRDGRTYTIKIKKKVLWQDADFFPGGRGRELVAQDFLYAWKRLSLPELQSPGKWIFDGKVESLAAVDDHTLRIQFHQPFPQFPHILAMAYTAPLPHEVFDKGGLFALNERVVGTGPYRFREYVRGSRIVLEKNPSFRGELYPRDGDEEARKAGLLVDAGKSLPFVEEVTFRIFKEDQPRWLSFSKGLLDVSGIPKDNFSSVVERGELRPEMASKGIQFMKMEQASLYMIYFNMKDPLLGKSADLRKAIALSFDRETFNERFRNGRGVMAASLVPRTVPGHAEGRFPYAYNPEKAKEVLKKAGYPEGKGLATLKLDLRGTSTNNRLQGEFIRDSLARNGIKVEVVLNSLPGYLEKERNGNLQITFGVWDSDYPDAENFLALLYGKNISPGPNISNYRNAAFDRIYEKVAGLAPSRERERLIAEAESLAYRDLPVAPLFYPLAFSVAHGWVRNFRPNIQVINHMKYFNVDLEAKARLASQL
jgi:ABC-type transport system substrate-binding protein